MLKQMSAAAVGAQGLPGGHNLQEEVPDLVLSELQTFLCS